MAGLFIFMNTAAVFTEVKDIINIKSLLVVDSAIVFRQTNNDSSCVLEEFGGVIAHITQPLYGYSFSLDPGCQSQTFHYIFHSTYFTDTKKYTQASRFPAATNA